jgi:hypothetical protein
VEGGGEGDGSSDAAGHFPFADGRVRVVALRFLVGMLCEALVPGLSGNVVKVVKAAAASDLA